LQMCEKKSGGRDYRVKKANKNSGQTSCF